jgi:hypothetical protein
MLLLLLLGSTLGRHHIMHALASHVVLGSSACWW